jgi:hypothetical protein
MNIYFAVVALSYIMILILAYGITIFTKLEKKKSEEIINKAFTNAYSILAFGLLIVYTLFMLPHIPLSHQTTSYLILASKYISVFTLGCSLFLLTRKNSSRNT